MTNSDSWTIIVLCPKCEEVCVQDFFSDAPHGKGRITSTIYCPRCNRAFEHTREIEMWTRDGDEDE